MCAFITEYGELFLPGGSNRIENCKRHEGRQQLRSKTCNLFQLGDAYEGSDANYFLKRQWKYEFNEKEPESVKLYSKVVRSDFKWKSYETSILQDPYPGSPNYPLKYAILKATISWVSEVLSICIPCQL